MNRLTNALIWTGCLLMLPLMLVCYVILMHRGFRDHDEIASKSW
jgi:hypothetical protein